MFTLTLTVQSHNRILVEGSYSGEEALGFEYRLSTISAWTAFESFPLTIEGLGASTPFDDDGLEIRAVLAEGYSEPSDPIPFSTPSILVVADAQSDEVEAGHVQFDHEDLEPETEYVSAAALEGDVEDTLVSTQGWETLAESLQASIDGDIVVEVIPQSQYRYNKHPSIVGSVGISTTPSAVISFVRNASLVGAVTLSLAAAADMEYDPVAPQYEIAGDITLSATPEAQFEYHRHASIQGDVALVLSPESGFDHARHAAIEGDVLLSFEVDGAPVFLSAGTINGDVTVSLTPAALFEHRRNASIEGDSSILLTPSAVTDYQRHASIAGDVVLGVSPASDMVYAEAEDRIVGDVEVSFSINADMVYVRHAILDGSVSLSLTPNSDMSADIGAVLQRPLGFLSTERIGVTYTTEPVN